MKHRLFGFALIAGFIGLVTQASSQAAVGAEYGEPAFTPGSASLSTSYRYPSYGPRWGITPVIGTQWWGNGWGPFIDNLHSLGLVVDVPTSAIFSVEVEGGQSTNRIRYPAPFGFHNFEQYILGANGKIYLFRGVVNPYVGGGLSFVYYKNMHSNFPFPHSFDQWIGSTQVYAGTEANVSESVSIGMRGSWFIPTFNRPYTVEVPGPGGRLLAAPGFEEAAAINTSFYRIVGTVRVSL